MGKKLKRGFQSDRQASRLARISSTNKRNEIIDLPTVDQDHPYAVNVEKKVEKEEEEEVFPIDDVILSNGNPSWGDGRRIVELGVLAKGLSGCSRCGLPLQLAHTLSINTYGLASILKIPCNNTRCKFVNFVPTGKKHDGVWDSNSKLATAMVHSGIGGRQVNSFLSALNIPPVSNNVLSKREAEIGKAVEVVADKSINEHLFEEMDMSIRDGETEGLTVSVDGGWQKRGSGRSYDSLSGHCSMIGTKTGKIIGYGVRSKSCKTCNISASKGFLSKQHDCRKNWEGSSKAMEQDIVLEMIKSCKDKGVEVETLIADDDTTTISRIRSQINPHIKKRSDKNHVKKNITSALYSLRVKHKKLKNPKVFKYLLKCISYVLAQNEGNPEGIKKGLEAIGRHPFGDHSFCEESWCHHITNSQKKFSAFPYGKPLTDIPLKIALSDLMSTYKMQSVKLSTMGSTQANESFNKTVSSKAPKTLFYGGSASLNRRVASAVAQKNEGQHYLSKVYKELGLSPGQNTSRLALLRDMQARKRRAIATTRQFKLRRIQLKNERSKTNSSAELREGDCYSGCIDEQVTQDIQLIPAPRIPPTDVIDVRATSNTVYFDLETTGLDRTSHIIQMAAVNGNEEWQTFVRPKKEISPAAGDITGISFSNGQLCHKGSNVESSTITSAIDAFINFLIQQGKDVIIAGHNIKSFDCHVLFHALEKTKRMDEFRKHVIGFLDTKLLFRATHPGLPSYTQQNLVLSFLKSDYSAHDALQDVVYLQKLVNCFEFNDDSKKALFSTNSAWFSYESVKFVKHNLPSLQGLIRDKVISKSMGRKIAISNLNCASLQLAFSRGEEDGIRQLLSDNSGGRPRVTKSSKVISDIAQHFMKSVPQNI